MDFRPGNREKGWNDPPEFLHNNVSDASAESQPQRKNLLNQRVAHNFNGVVPSNEAAGENTAGVKPDGPPKMSAPPQTPAHVGPKTEKLATTEEILPLARITDILMDKIGVLKNNNCKTSDEIKKRIDVFSSNWTKLNPKVKERMSILAKALEANELSKADEVHVNLVLDFPSEVINWMVGVKKLIHELKQLADAKPQDSVSPEPQM